jgi:hypothetical protein
MEENKNEYIDDNKNNKGLEEFLIYNENKDKMSQNENNYILFGIIQMKKIKTIQKIPQIKEIF